MVRQYNKERFMNIVNQCKYKDKDEIEARQFLSANVEALYVSANHEFAKYYIVRFDNKIMATIMLERCGSLIYFVTKDFIPDYAFRLIKAVRRLADATVKRAGPITTTTADFYIEALRFNRLAGFELYKVKPRRTVWVYRR